MQQDAPSASRPSFVSGPAWPLGLSLMLSAAARDASLGLLQGSLGLAASTLYVTGRELLGWGLFIPATMTRLIPAGMGLLLPGGAPQQPQPAAQPQTQLQTRVRFTHTHGVEPLKAIHHHQHHQHRKQQRQQQGAWSAALPAGPVSPSSTTSPQQQQPWTHLVALAQQQHHHHSKDASRVRHQQQRLAHRMHQGKATFRLPPVLPTAHLLAHAASATTTMASAGGWVITSSAASASSQAAAGPQSVLSRCPSSLAVKSTPLRQLVKTNSGSSRVAARGALSASPVMTSEDEEWLPLTHLALRSSML